MFMPIWLRVLVCLIRAKHGRFTPLFSPPPGVSAATETRQPGESDRGVPAQTEAAPGLRVLRPHGAQRAGPPSQRVRVHLLVRSPQSLKRGKK